MSLVASLAQRSSVDGVFSSPPKSPFSSAATLHAPLPRGSFQTPHRHHQLHSSSSIAVTPHAPSPPHPIRTEPALPSVSASDDAAIISISARSPVDSHAAVSAPVQHSPPSPALMIPGIPLPPLGSPTRCSTGAGDAPQQLSVQLVSGCDASAANLNITCDSPPTDSAQPQRRNSFSPVPSFRRASMSNASAVAAAGSASTNAQMLMFPACRQLPVDKPLSEISTHNTLGAYLVPSKQIDNDDDQDDNDDDERAPWYEPPATPATAPTSPLVSRRSTAALSRRQSAFSVASTSARSATTRSVSPAVSLSASSPVATAGQSPASVPTLLSLSEYEATAEVTLPPDLVALSSPPPPPPPLPALLVAAASSPSGTVTSTDYSDAGRKFRLKFAERPPPPPHNLSPRSLALSEELRMQRLAEAIGANAPPAHLRNRPIEVTAFGHLLRAAPQLRRRAEVDVQDPVGTVRFLRDVEDRELALAVAALRGSALGNARASPLSPSQSYGASARAITPAAVTALHTFGGADAIDSRTKAFLLRRGQLVGGGHHRASI